MHGPRCFLQEPPGHVHLCMGAYGEHSSRLRNFEGFKLVTNLKETKDAKCKYISVPLYKKGTIDSPDNYRGIALLSVFSKLYTSVLNRRVTFYVNMYDKISECQAGFREGYSNVDNAFILNAFVDKYLSKKRHKLYVAFVDFKKRRSIRCIGGNCGTC